MKNVFTLLMLLAVSTVWGQEFHDIPWWPNNGDAETATDLDYGADSSTVKMNGFQLILPGSWYPNRQQAYVGWENTGFHPGKGVDGSQAVGIEVLPGNDGGWTIQMRTEAIDIFPSGGGEYRFNWSVKAENAVDDHPFYHVVALFDENWQWLGGANEIGLDTVTTIEQRDNLHTEYAHLSAVVTIPDSASRADGPVELRGVTRAVRYVTFAAQCAKIPNTYYWDNFSVEGPESFYDIAYEVYTISEAGDTAVAEGATVVFADDTYTTDAEGKVMLSEISGSDSYIWTVSTEGKVTENGIVGYESKNGLLEPTYNETIVVYLIEQITPLSVTPEMTSRIFPNPASDVVKLISDHSKIKRVELLSLTGAVLMSKEFNSSEVDLNISSFKTGVYFIKTLNELNQIHTERLVIE